MKSLLYLANLRLPTEKAYGIQIAQMCGAFAESGIRVKLAHPWRRNAIREDIHSYYSVHQNFEVRQLPTPDFYLPGRFDWLAVNMKNAISALVLTMYGLIVKADVIYSRDEQLLYILSFFKKNLVFESHKYSSRRAFIYRRLQKAGVKIVAISNGIRDCFVQLGCSPDRVLVARDGVDVQRFSIDTTKEECRKMLRLPEDKIIVLYTGHLYAWKGARILAEAARHLDSSYAVVCVGGTRDDVQRFRSSYASGANISFLGWRRYAEMPMFMKSADIVVLPNSGEEEISRSFTSPLKLFEYMASGTPIVASDLSVIREVLNSTNAMLVASDSPELLANAIRNTAENMSEARMRALQARQDVEQYSWGRRAARILAYL